ncbi:MAG TPA: hypothetical protein VE988_19885 [Gemmataceae bacterium]|nr:hypothetical protein [Gemmataceae bacterium]
MIEDEVVREVRAAREAFAASHGFDIRKMVAALHDLGVASGRELVRFAPRPAQAGPNQSLQPSAAAISISQDSTSLGAAAAPEL